VAIVRRAVDDFRVLAIVALLLIPTEALHGQVLIGYLLGEKLSSPTFNMGFEVGINFATLEGLAGAERTTKTVFGLFADWRFSEHFHLTSAFLPFAGRGADGLEPVPTGDPAIDSQTQGGTMSRSMHLIEFPVLLKWAPKRNDGFRIGAGPSFGLITGANDRYESKTAAGTPYIVERDIGDQIPGLDFGVSFDVEYRLQFLSIAARYTHGLTDISQSGSGTAVYSRTLTGTGRIYLGKKGPPKPK
jgi:hypothetical protein